MARVIGITQARIGSSRLPGKVLLPVTESLTMLELHLIRAKKSRLVEKWIVATTQENGSEAISSIAQNLEVDAFHGSTENVLDRFYQAQLHENADYIVRITSDCPLIDGALIDEVVEYCLANALPYYTNTINAPFPDGVDVEIFSVAALTDAWNNASSVSDKEHVTPYIRRKYPVNSWHATEVDYSALRLTVDENTDLQLIRQLVDALGTGAGWQSYCEYLSGNEQLTGYNKHLFRNSGYMKSKFDEIELRQITQFERSQAYKNAIHDLIPGGAHTYSKGDDQFPERAPASIVSGKNAHVWDLDGNEFLDCSLGLTSVSLGHAFPAVVEAVTKELQNGVNFQRPAFLEKEMAETFLGLVPQHDMIKFAKNGSVVTTAAVKLARAKTGRPLIAFPGDHPFYSYDDWFIISTPCDEGIPTQTKSLSVQFKSCDIESLRTLFDQHPGQIACVITEPEKLTCYDKSCSCGGDPGTFLRAAIELTQQNGALFILDEMITGFKTDFPGSISKYQLDPDMATWGKGIANGFSFCALTGKKDIMELGGIRNTGAEKVFLISTTHGGETNTMAAAIQTIRTFKNEPVVAENHRKGQQLIDLCQELVTRHELSDFIEVIPCPWMIGFAFKDAGRTASSGFRTLFMQEMIARGVLFQGIFVPCFTHTEDDLYYFAKAFEASLYVYKEALEKGYEAFLTGEPAKAVFRKYL